MPNERRVIKIGPQIPISLSDVYEVAENGVFVELSSEAYEQVQEARDFVEKLITEKQPVYGLTTGFGKFKDVFIDTADTANLQRNLIRSHSVGVGDYLPKNIVRASLFVRINSLSKGYSGVRVEFLERALQILNSNITPLVPSQGSVGASGDLAPLSHMGLTLMGEGQVLYNNSIVDASQALSEEGILPIQFASKEGLAWTNGTSVMLGTLALTLRRALHLSELCDVAAALTLEAVRGVTDAFHPALHELRPYQGQKIVAENILQLVGNSQLVNAEKGRVQDSYSLRCVPQVHGASRDMLDFVSRQVAIELNAVTDNPLIFPKLNKVIAGGNFHGEPLAQAADALAIAVAEIANISERRTAKLVDSGTNEGLPLFLVSPEMAGLHSGMMIPQYAAAALVSENKVLSHPASVDSIPTSANQEDHVSMGSISCRKALEVVKNAENVLAIEFLTALQAVEFRNTEHLGRGSGRAYELLRKRVSPVTEDRVLSYDIEKIRNEICDHVFLSDVYSATVNVV